MQLGSIRFIVVVASMLVLKRRLRLQYELILNGDSPLKHTFDTRAPFIVNLSLVRLGECPLVPTLLSILRLIL